MRPILSLRTTSRTSGRNYKGCIFLTSICKESKYRLMESGVYANSNVTSTQRPLCLRENGASYSIKKPRLLDLLRESLRSRHYSRRTEQTYCYWVRRFIIFHGVRHPAEMAEGWGRVPMPNALDRKYPQCFQRMALAMGLSPGEPVKESIFNSSARNREVSYADNI